MDDAERALKEFQDRIDKAEINQIRGKTTSLWEIIITIPEVGVPLVMF